MTLKEFIDLTGLESKMVKAGEVNLHNLPADMEMLEVVFPKAGGHHFIVYVPATHTIEQAFFTLSGIIWEYALKIGHEAPNPFFDAMSDMMAAENFLDDVNDILKGKDKEKDPE